MDVIKTRTTTELLIERLLRRYYPELEFLVNHQVCGYYPDFYFPKQRVLLEIDGSIHDSHAAQAKDHRKDLILQQAGFTVIRLRNADIWNDHEATAHVIGSSLGIIRPWVNQETMWRRFSRRKN